MRIFLTGAAGFIGYHTAVRLIERGDEVIGFDNLNPYYDVSLKEARLARLIDREGFRFIKADLADRTTVDATFAAERPERVVHLAAQAGVRYSLDHPHAYIEANITGFLHVLEGCRHHGVEHLVFASSSSVYGANRKLPFKVSVWAAGHGPQILHGLRAMGSAGHVAVRLHPQHLRRPPDPSV
jgi:UDP-glucuronate 4-epimerase